MAKFTNTDIKKIIAKPDGTKRITDKKEDGLAVRFNASGATFIWQRERKDDDGERIRSYKKIGPFNEDVLGVDEARARARAHNAEFLRGQADGSVATTRIPTVKQQAEAYFAREVTPRLRPRTQEGYERWRNLLVAEIGHRKIVEVTPGDVERMRDVITEENGPRAANGVVGLFGQIYRDWAAWARNSTPDPTSVVRRNHVPRREFKLVPEEVETFFRVAEADEDRDLWIFLAYTGCRRNEALNATREQFDLDGKHPTWTVPADIAKNKKPTPKALAPEVIEIVRKTENGLLFPSRRLKPRPGIKREWNRLRAAAGGVLDGWTPHTLRKLAATVARQAGLSQKQIADQLGQVDLESQASYAFGTDDEAAMTTGVWTRALRKYAKPATPKKK